MYVLVRSDLPGPHLTVQAAHAAMASINAFGQPNRTHPHLVICTVPGEPELLAAFEELKEQGVPACAWDEEDMDGQFTAVATGPLDSEQRKALRKYPLLR